MKLEDAIRTFTNIQKGAYTKFIFKSDVKVKAEYKNTVQISKYSIATARFGINYSKTASYVPAKKTTKKSNYISILKNILEYNTNTDKFYVTAYTSPNRTRTAYIVYKDGKIVSVSKDKESIREYVTESVYTSKCNQGIYKVNLANVIRVGKEVKNAEA